jgi:hypothetical protein
MSSFHYPYANKSSIDHKKRIIGISSMGSSSSTTAEIPLRPDLIEEIKSNLHRLDQLEKINGCPVIFSCCNWDTYEAFLRIIN